MREHVSQHLDTLHMYLLGNSERPGAQVGIIAQFMHDNHAKLAEEKNWGYHLADYILEVENMVEYYMSAQSAAYALRVLFIDGACLLPPVHVLPRADHDFYSRRDRH